MSQKVITILGSTGSIGTQALDVVRENPDRYKIESLTAGRNASLLIEQIKEFKPAIAVIADESK
ncbi:MAG: 1-deoxy-D-xylulose-5-phosphate reductoisomerase, partial [Paludibacteraceae bacterium]|nr:1-deoxy-D-xylulose-5-phosphate reductoisomerase [Paludibacteraceae bacterium]